jgi:CubicO group peptidase (beta-lactamase class C family)
MQTFPPMRSLSAWILATAVATQLAAEPRQLPGVGAAMREQVAKQEIAGAVTLVATKDAVLHLETTGFADVAAQKPMQTDTVFWIASMTKPVTAVAALMLQDDGKLNVQDSVAKYLPEFASLKTPSGKPANLTIIQLLTHTSGLGEADSKGAQNARTLADLVPLWMAAPMQFEPGSKWGYCQSSINAAGRIVEVVSGMSFDAFLEKRLFGPLGMTSTTFYPGELSPGRLVTAYARNKDTGRLEPVPPRPEYGPRERPPQGNGGLYSTAEDYARFCQMLLGGGTYKGRRFLSGDSMKFLTAPQTPDNMPTGFFQNDTFGRRGTNYGWALGTCVLKTPHEGVPAMLSPGTFGHGGAWGTQAWMDPVKGVAYILMVQRANFPNSDASDVRRAFQQAAADALGRR